MDLALLTRKSDIEWWIEPHGGMRVPGILYATEALIRESELIKKHRPKYNVLMRDDKNYFYVGFTREKYPKIFITHQPQTKDYKLKTINYVGPFTDGGALRSVLKTLRRVFPYCTCTKPHKTPCLNSRIGRCLGVCCTAPIQPMQPSHSFSPRQPAAPRTSALSPRYAGTMPKGRQNPFRSTC